MTLPTHILAGAIVGKLTGNYAAALGAAAAVDLDHTVSYWRHGILFEPKQLWRTLTAEADPWHDQRNFLHSLWTFSLALVFSTLVFPTIAVAFIGGYFSHLLLDALDTSEFYPFYPSRKFPLTGPVRYFSRGELLLDAGLLLIFLLI